MKNLRDSMTLNRKRESLTLTNPRRKQGNRSQFAPQGF